MAILADSIPEPPKALKFAAEKGWVIPFIGGGVSRLCGSPSWEEFSHLFLESLNRNVSYADLDQLRSIRDPRKKISIACDIAKVAEVKPEDLGLIYKKLLHPVEQRDAGANAYESLFKLGSIFVTTNYDHWLDGTTRTRVSTDIGLNEAENSTPNASRQPDVYDSRDQLTTNKLYTPGSVLHLHGSYKNPGDMILSTSDYINHYSHEAVQSFLIHLFSHRTVLFIGYSLDELEIVEYVIKSSTPTEKEPPEQSKKGKNREANHFLLMPVMAHQKPLRRHLVNYLKFHCGVNVVEYSIDSSGHDQLSNVLAYWAKTMPVKPPLTIDKLALIDQGLSGE